MRHKIIIVDDEPAIRFAVKDFLETQGYDVEEADSCKSVLELFRSIRPDAAIIDYSLPDGNALELLPKLREIDSSVPLIILTGNASIDLAVRAIKEGAEHFLTKPVELTALHIILKRILEHQRNRQKQLANKSRQQREEINPFLGTSAAICELEEKARKVVNAESPILIQGETGAGKGIMAVWLHNNGPRGEEAIVDLNCAGLSREFLETELFGHEKGAFTGATNNKIGLLEVAHRGTIFLDEIGDVSLDVQPKLLKVLEEKRFRRLGDVRDRQVDIRLITATHQNIEQMVREKKFRSDLYFRISAIPLFVPALRQRPEDIPVLAQTFLQHFAARHGQTITLSEEAMLSLKAYSWPGNIRELRNVLERAVILSDGETLKTSDLYFNSNTDSEPLTEEIGLTLEEMERRHIERVLRNTNWHVEQTAKRLNIPRSSLYQKLQKYGIQKPTA